MQCGCEGPRGQGSPEIKAHGVGTEPRKSSSEQLLLLLSACPGLGLLASTEQVAALFHYCRGSGAGHSGLSFVLLHVPASPLSLRVSGWEFYTVPQLSYPRKA